MKTSIFKAVSFLLVFTIICGLLYTTVITVAAQVIFPKQANGSIIEVDGKLYGSELIGQSFTDKSHLWGRPVNIDVATYKDEQGKALAYAAPSNLSPATEEYEQIVAQRVKDIKAAHSSMGDTPIPVELVTGSGSGLDPQISPAAAAYQVDRLAQENGMSKEEVENIIKKCTSGRFLGVFGEENVNVLKVNLMLEGILK